MESASDHSSAGIYSNDQDSYSNSDAESKSYLDKVKRSSNHQHDQVNVAVKVRRPYSPQSSCGSSNAGSNESQKEQDESNLMENHHLNDSIRKRLKKKKYKIISQNILRNQANVSSPNINIIQNRNYLNDNDNEGDIWCGGSVDPDSGSMAVELSSVDSVAVNDFKSLKCGIGSNGKENDDSSKDGTVIQYAANDASYDGANVYDDHDGDEGKDYNDTLAKQSKEQGNNASDSTGRSYGAGAPSQKEQNVCSVPVEKKNPSDNAFSFPTFSLSSVNSGFSSNICNYVDDAKQWSSKSGNSTSAYGGHFMALSDSQRASDWLQKASEAASYKPILFSSSVLGLRPVDACYDSDRSIATSLFVEVESLDEDGTYTGYGNDQKEEETLGGLYHTDGEEKGFSVLAKISLSDYEETGQSSEGPTNKSPDGNIIQANIGTSSNIYNSNKTRENDPDFLSPLTYVMEEEKLSSIGNTEKPFRVEVSNEPSVNGDMSPYSSTCNTSVSMKAIGKRKRSSASFSSSYSGYVSSASNRSSNSNPGPLSISIKRSRVKHQKRVGFDNFFNNFYSDNNTESSPFVQVNKFPFTNSFQGSVSTNDDPEEMNNSKCSNSVTSSVDNISNAAVANDSEVQLVNVVDPVSVGLYEDGYDGASERGRIGEIDGDNTDNDLLLNASDDDIIRPHIERPSIAVENDLSKLKPVNISSGNVSCYSSNVIARPLVDDGVSLLSGDIGYLN